MCLTLRVPQPQGPIPSQTYCDSHHIGAPGGILGDPGNVVMRGELGDIIVGVQELDHNIRCGTELLGGVHLDGQELGSREPRACLSPAESLPSLVPLVLDQHHCLSAARCFGPPRKAHIFPAS